MKKRVLVVSFSNLKSDPRVNRQLRALTQEYEVTGAGTADSEIPGVRFIALSWERKNFAEKLVGGVRIGIGAYDSFYWALSATRAAWKKLEGTEFDLIIANDIDTLPIAIKLARGKPVFFDAHEYSPLEAEERFVFRTLISPFRTALLKKYLPQVSAMSTVCRGISEKYAKEFGVPSEVITNAPDYHDLRPYLRSSGPIRIVHHGIGAPSRNLELTVDVMNLLDERFEFSFMLMDDSKYIDTLKARAKSNPRIHFLDPVPMRELPNFLNQFDVGFFLLPEINFNYRHALPNKFFEFIQARLALAIGPSPEMANLVTKYNLGVISKTYDPKDMAKTLSELTWEKINAFKENSHRHSREFSAESNLEKILEISAFLMKTNNESARI